MDVKSFDQSHANVLVPSDEGPGSARPDLDVSIAGLTYNGEGHEAEPPPRDNTNVATKPNQASAAGAVPGDHSHVICDSPRSHTPESSLSGVSMNSNGQNFTPPESPSKLESPAATTTAQIAGLSLENEYPTSRDQHRRGREPLIGIAPTASKRAASSELPHASGRQISDSRSYGNSQPSGQKGSQTQGRQGRRGKNARSKQKSLASKGRHEPQIASHMADHFGYNQHPSRTTFPPAQRDSGYDTMPSRANTFQQAASKANVTIADTSQCLPLPKLNEDPIAQDSEQHAHKSNQPSGKERYPSMMLQPESSPISKDQLAAEVKGIYAGLVMVEAKCINIDNTQAADPNIQLGPEQWQALIALHRTLLYEHHDFLMATQHPSATLALKGLAAKYSMPARMWRHGIHAFLEVLRHRRPDSQDYMVAFIYLAYQMMALLFETVPIFTDTWIECLGDLARYRMAIEEEKEAHSIWGGVAARWYNTASDRHPNIGRLYHHLGILERPSLRKYFLYSKSLTCVIPFPNARDSLTTLCGAIVQESQIVQSSSAEARIVTFHAQLFSKFEDAKVGSMASTALSLLSRLSASKIRDIGVELVVTNVGSILQLGSPNNKLWQLFGKAIRTSVQSSRPSVAAAPGTARTNTEDESQQLSHTSNAAPSFVYDFFYTCFDALVRHRNDNQSLQDTLPSVHTALAWTYGVCSLRSRLDTNDGMDTCSSLLDPIQFSWGELSDYLNKLGKIEPINARTVEFARQGTFLTPERTEDAKPLSEDYMIRGLIWTQFYYPSDWFHGHVDDEGRTIETPTMRKARVERVQWLGLYFAFHVGHLRFEMNTGSFFVLASTPSVGSKQIKPESFSASQPQIVDEPSPQSRTSTLSAHSDSDGYAVVAAPKSKLSRTYASVASKPTKVRQDYSNVKVVDDEYMNLDA